jgi:hypothetical protein
MRSNTIGRLRSPYCGMIQITTTSSVDGIGREAMSIDEKRLIIDEITVILATAPEGMKELPKKDQIEVTNLRLEMASTKNFLLVSVGENPLTYNDVELAKIAGVTPENIRHMVRHSYRSFQNKVGPKCRGEMVEGLREEDGKRKSQSDESQGGTTSSLQWDEADARAQMGGNN